MEVRRELGHNLAMPSTFIPTPRFPLVPLLPGVPQLVRSVLFPPPALPTIGAQNQGALWSSSQLGPVWGIFDKNNRKVLAPDSTLNFNQRKEWSIPDFPIQRGSYATYNKVQIPGDYTERFSKGGSLSDRTAFLKTIDDIAGDLNLYSIVTPERTYIECNIRAYEVTRRDKNAAYFLDDVDIHFREIRQVTAQYSATSASTANAKNPAAVPAVNLGNVQPGATVAIKTAAKAANAVVMAPN